MSTKCRIGTTISAKVYGWMHVRGITQEEMAVRCHMSTATFGRRMRAPETLNLSEIERLELVTGMSLIEEVGNERQN